MTCKEFNESKFEEGKEIHFLISELHSSIDKKRIDIEMQQILSTIEAKYWTLVHALKSLPKDNKIWLKHPDAFKLVYGKAKIKGRKESSINLGERVRDYYFVQYLRERYELTLEKAIADYIARAKVSDIDGCRFDRIKANYNYVKPKIQYFLRNIK
ncbi:hypothetical protein [Polynucleobacter sp. AP-Reno-20A-A9]|uniref:hypothetical protein n=1 Tax=Polynucleobacter sp. AP-Reno-20A-A9 TaxID=2576925 RepID=UPI001C0DBA07|nr:hypothetical protein [Polynucleobacter sp. AP-Reno-20A-A9]MBU3628527.1 hypothetical protein [Polynucleobacter sp. AP-Reno-20A-A9]